MCNTTHNNNILLGAKRGSRRNSAFSFRASIIDRPPVQRKIHKLCSVFIKRIYNIHTYIAAEFSFFSLSFSHSLSLSTPPLTLVSSYYNIRLYLYLLP